MEWLGGMGAWKYSLNYIIRSDNQFIMFFNNSIFLVFTSKSFGIDQPIV